MRKLNESLGTVEYDGLIYDLYPPAEPFMIVLRKAESEAVVLRRGTVLALSGGEAGDGKMVPLGTEAAEKEELLANCVLTDDTVVGTGEDVTATAYRTGHFNLGRLIVAENYEITDADKETLRDVGILISEAMEP